MIDKQVLHLFSNLDQEKKQCGICKLHLPLSNFGTDGGAKYLRYECKDCAKKQTQVLKLIKKSAPPVSELHTCPICNKNADQINENKNKKTNPWCLDHNHKTNKFRGYLCHKCNLGLGNFNDDIDRLKNAMKYLIEHNSHE